MIEVKDIKIFGLEESIIQSGFPMVTGELANNFYNEVEALKQFFRCKDKEIIKDHEWYKKSEKHFKRACKLGKTPNGSGHGNYLKGVRVNFNLKFPEYISPQLQRYNWFDIVSSESKMHRLTKMNIKDSVNKYVDDVVIDNLNKWIDIYNNFPKDKNFAVKSPLLGESKYFTDKKNNSFEYLSKYEIFMKIISNCPMGLEKWMGISTNYMQLKTIYQQRKSHKLKEDYKVLCDMIENLPYFKELMLGD